MASEAISIEQCRSMDQKDPLAAYRDRFVRPPGGRIPLDANSIGAMPVTVPNRIQEVLQDQWVRLGRRAWSETDWLTKPRELGAAIAPVIGSDPEDVTVSDTTTVNLFKAIYQAWSQRRQGSILVTESGNFPTDIYVMEGLSRLLGGAPEIIFVDGSESLDALLASDRAREIAVVSLSLVDYRSGARWSMAEVNAAVQGVGGLIVWDLSHAAGAVEIDLNRSNADFAVGCGYKYLCGGPGGPAYIWAHPRHQNRAWPALCGWMGHKDTFAFAQSYEPAADVSKFLAGTPSVIANEIFAEAAAIWREITPETVWAKHRSLTDLTLALIDQEVADHGIAVNSPRTPERRGGHVTLHHAHAGAVSEALVKAGVVCSYRKPDAVRFGISPLYISHVDMFDAIDRLRGILETEIWRDPSNATTAI